MHDPKLKLRDFRQGDESVFRHLNEAWIQRWFKLEAADLDVFNDPQTYILDKGGRIFLAELDGEVIGCCGLLPIAPGEYEVVKMAVSDRAQGRGAGRSILQHTIHQAFAMGATRLYLESNQVLKPALHLYESLGFQHLPKERLEPSPYARANVFMELLAPQPGRETESEPES